MEAQSPGEEYSHFFQVRLDLFDGPIDLLLHLVKQHELPLEKLSLAAVADQYFACLERARNFDLDVAGEYLVIAATLLAIKSSILLNKPVEFVEDDEGNLNDPQEELVRRLRELEAFRQGALLLSCRKQLGVDVFAPTSILKEVAPPPATFRAHDPLLLGAAFKRLLDNLPAASVLTFTLEAVSIVERMMEIMERLRASNKPLVFYDLIPNVSSRSSVIASFLALLELSKRQVIEVLQVENFKEIHIQLLGKGMPLGEALVSEFDAEERRELVGEQ